MKSNKNKKCLSEFEEEIKNISNLNVNKEEQQVKLRDVFNKYSINSSKNNIKNVLYRFFGSTVLHKNNRTKEHIMCSNKLEKVSEFESTYEDKIWYKTFILSGVSTNYNLISEMDINDIMKTFNLTKNEAIIIKDLATTNKDRIPIKRKVETFLEWLENI